MPRLVACPSCSVHTRIGDSKCPGCGTRLAVECGAFLRTASAVLMGLSLTACPSDDDGDDTMGGSGTSSPTGMATESTTSTSTTAGTDDPSMTSVDPTTFGSSDAMYGVPSTTGGETDDSATTGSTSSTGGGVTGTDTDSSTDTGSDSSSSGDIQPPYGVGDT